MTGLRVLFLALTTRALPLLGLEAGEGSLFLSVYSITKKIEISRDHGSEAENLPSMHEALGSVVRMRGEERGGG